jgi:hypothetical protein
MKTLLSREKLNIKFVKELGKCKDPIVFLGLAKLLSVDLVDENKVERDFGDVLSGILDRFEDLNTGRAKEIFDVLHEANKDNNKRSLLDALSTKDSKH